VPAGLGGGGVDVAGRVDRLRGERVPAGGRWPRRPSRAGRRRRTRSWRRSGCSCREQSCRGDWPTASSTASATGSAGRARSACAWRPAPPPAPGPRRPRSALSGRRGTPSPWWAPAPRAWRASRGAAGRRARGTRCESGRCRPARWTRTSGRSRAPAARRRCARRRRWSPRGQPRRRRSRGRRARRRDADGRGCRAGDDVIGGAWLEAPGPRRPPAESDPHSGQNARN